MRTLRIAIVMMFAIAALRAADIIGRDFKPDNAGRRGGFLF